MRLDGHHRYSKSTFGANKKLTDVGIPPLADLILCDKGIIESPPPSLMEKVRGRHMIFFGVCICIYFINLFSGLSHLHCSTARSWQVLYELHISCVISKIAGLKEPFLRCQQQQQQYKQQHQQHLDDQNVQGAGLVILMEIEITISDPQLKLEHMTTRVKFLLFKISSS